MKQKGFAPIIILVLIALAVVGYFGYKNYWPKPQMSGVTSLVSTPTAAPAATTDPTTTWKTYVDKTYGFSFKHPSQYQVSKGSFVNNGNENRWGVKVVDTSTKVKNELGEETNNPIFDITLLSEFIYNPDANTPKVDLTIGKNIFKYFQATKYEMFDVYHFEINKFSIVTYMDNQHVINPNFDQILSTFRFTN